MPDLNVPDMNVMDMNVTDMNMTDVTETLAYLHERITRRPRVMLVLGSGFASLADALEEVVRLPFEHIPGFVPATVEGHRGALIAGRLEGVECILLQGRCHAYEGHSSDAITLPVRVMAALGARTMIVTNAAGAVSRALRAGDVMILHGHINLLWRYPQVGTAAPRDWRFPHRSEPYDRELQTLAERVALAERIRAARGVYCAVLGPSYETPAEVRMLERLGADAVGMSTVPEVLVARSLGARVLGISLITNAAAGLSVEPLDHAHVLAAGAEAAERLTRFMRGILREIGRGKPSESGRV